MDGHCESTLTLQLAGRTDSFDIHSSYTCHIRTYIYIYMILFFSPGICLFACDLRRKKWRLSWPPSINNGSFAKVRVVDAWGNEIWWHTFDDIRFAHRHVDVLDSTSNLCAHVSECSVNAWIFSMDGGSSKRMFLPCFGCRAARCLARCGRPRGTGRPSCGWWALQCQGAVTTEGLLWIGPEGVDMSWYELTVPQTHAWAIMSPKIDCAVLHCPLPGSSGWLDANTHCDARTRHPWKGWQMSSCWLPNSPTLSEARLC